MKNQIIVIRQYLYSECIQFRIFTVMPYIRKIFQSKNLFFNLAQIFARTRFSVLRYIIEYCL